MANLVHGQEALKLTDYGHMYRVSPLHNVIKVGSVRGTPGFRAPEADTLNAFLTVKSDLWPIGRVIGETFDGTDGYMPGMPENSRNEYTSKFVREMADKCMSEDWNARPTLQQLREIKNNILQELPSHQDHPVRVCRKLHDVLVSSGVWGQYLAQLNKTCTANLNLAIHSPVSDKNFLRSCFAWDSSTARFVARKCHFGDQSGSRVESATILLPQRCTEQKSSDDNFQGRTGSSSVAWTYRRSCSDPRIRLPRCLHRAGRGVVGTFDEQ
jgi:serine/threonine protein kinase